MQMRDAVIVSAARTEVGKAPRGSLREPPPSQLAMPAVRAALERAPGLDPGEVEDLVLGCAMPEGAQGLNMARQVGLGAGLPDSASAMTINRFCASGLQALALATQAVQTGVHDVVVAGGMESMSYVPMIGHRFAPDPTLADTRPQVYLSMGLTAENVAERFDVTRDDQDAWGLRSHLRASAAQREGRFAEEVAPVRASLTDVDADGRPSTREVAFDADEGIRHDADAAQMGKLKPVFAAGGSVTAGNSSQMSDGAAAMVVMTGERDRVDTGQADLVDRQRRDGHRDAGLHGRLTGRDLPGPGLQDLAHDHVLDLVRRDAGLLEGALDRDPTEIGAGEVLERAEQPAHRRPGPGDDDGTSHGCYLLQGFTGCPRTGPVTIAACSRASTTSVWPSATSTRRSPSTGTPTA